jgi:protein TonB
VLACFASIIGTKGTTMRTRNIARSAAFGAALVLATWAPIASAQDKEAPPAASPLVPSPLATASPSITPFRSQALNIDDYKKHAAGHIVAISKHELAESLPPILKSVVVLDITVDAEGNITRLAMWRSNGYEDLERIAMESVKRAGKLPAPSPEVLKGQQSVRFLETWLFRHDGRYHVRSVVPPDLPIDEIKDVARNNKKPGKRS